MGFLPDITRLAKDPPKAKKKLKPKPGTSSLTAILGSREHEKVRHEVTSHPESFTVSKLPPSYPKAKLRRVSQDRHAAAFRIAHLTDVITNPRLDPHLQAELVALGKVGTTRGRDEVPPELAKAYPRAYEKISEAAVRNMDDALKDDPVAQLAIDTVATAGLGSAAKGALTAAKLTKEALAAKEAADVGAETAAKAVAKEIPKPKLQTPKATERITAKPKQTVERVRTAPLRKLRHLKETPARVRNAPAAAREEAQALKTTEGRRLAAKRTGKQLYAHPVVSGLGVTYAGNQAGINAPGFKEGGAFVQGNIDALRHDPVGTLGQTGKGIAGAFTGPLALLSSAGSSAIHGDPGPFTREVSNQFQGTKALVSELASGDPKKVQDAVEHGTGLAWAVPLPALSRVRELKAYEDARGAVRGKVSERRTDTRAKLREKGDRITRHPVTDSKTGGEYVLRRTGKVIEGRRQRKGTAEMAAREKAVGVREGALNSKEVIKQIRKSKLSRGRRNAGDVVATVAAYGISRKRDRAMTQIGEIEKSIGPHHPDDIPHDTLTDLHALDFLRDHPELFRDTHFWQAIDAYKRQAKRIENSKRKKLLAVGDTYGVVHPEERLQQGVTVHGREVKAHFYKDPDTIRRKQTELTQARQDAKHAVKLAEKATPEEHARLAAVAGQIYAKAKKLERELRDYREGLKQAHKDYAHEVQGLIREKGHEQPAYVKDVNATRSVGLEAEPSFPTGRSARKQHMATGGARARGTVDRAFETLVEQSIHEPRMRRAMHRFTTNFVEKWARPIDGKRYLTSDEIRRAINRGELDESQYAVLHSQFFKQAILDPHKGGEEFLGEVRSSLDKPMRADIRDRLTDPGHKYVVVPKEALREFTHQMEAPKGIDKLFGNANRFLSRLILGYSPSWAVAQLVAEGIPAAVSIGGNPARWGRVTHFLFTEGKKLDEKDRAAIDGLVGESAGVITRGCPDRRGTSTAILT